jgi:hypothetical protein
MPETCVLCGNAQEYNQPRSQRIPYSGSKVRLPDTQVHVEIAPAMGHAIDFVPYPKPFRSGTEHPIQPFEQRYVSTGWHRLALSPGLPLIDHDVYAQAQVVLAPARIQEVQTWTAL